jgi:signal transduction histidine kinase
MIFTIVVLFHFNISSQQPGIESVWSGNLHSLNDTLRLIGYQSYGRYYAEINPDSSYVYAEKSLQLARQLQLRIDEAYALREIGYAFLNRGNYSRSLQLNLEALTILKDQVSENNVISGDYPGDDILAFHTKSASAQRKSGMGFTYQNLAILYANSGNYEKSLHHHHLAIHAAEQSGNISLQSIIYLTLNRVYLNLGKKDSALISIQKAYILSVQENFYRYFGSVLLNLGRTYEALGNQTMAIAYFREALKESLHTEYFRGAVASSLLLAEVKSRLGDRDSAYYFIQNAFNVAQEMDAPDLLLRIYTALARFYTGTGSADSVVKYQSMIIKINDSLFNAKQAQQFQNIDFEARQRQLEMEAAEKQFKARLQRNILLGSLGTFFLAVLLLWRNVRQRKKSAAILLAQKKELEATLINLKATQNQLIQSEKMASLGELTAGIAHEIQNPLNFVNNFSEVNKELIGEMKESMEKGNFDAVKSIAKDIEGNEEKIMIHGKRADGIVKSMLQHSRTSSGKKEPTDINALADEYLRLAYHGLRAKDKSFNAKFKTDFDNAIGKIDIIPQDIGRVILNLINNAFYAVTVRKSQQQAGYEPVVTVSTLQSGNKVEIRVRDNGNGIPKKIMDKIFQPFFTTKPAGEGTGLGLSLSYDIITKGHGGELRVVTKEGEGAEFIITLPA